MLSNSRSSLVLHQDRNRQLAEGERDPSLSSSTPLNRFLQKCYEHRDAPVIISGSVKSLRRSLREALGRAARERDRTGVFQQKIEVEDSLPLSVRLSPRFQRRPADLEQLIDGPLDFDAVLKRYEGVATSFRDVVQVLTGWSLKSVLSLPLCCL
jgi:hypothetical protein